MADPWSKEEADESERMIAEWLKKLTALESRQSDICPHCNSKVEQMQQIGRCVYARPCGCRLWQGRVPAAWKDTQGDFDIFDEDGFIAFSEDGE